MADVIRIELSGEEFKLLRKMLYRQLATMVDDCLVPLERCKEEYRQADAMAIKVSRAEWESQAESRMTEGRGQMPDDGGQRTASQEVGDAQQAPAKPQQAQTSFKPALPPLETYQQQSQRTDGGGQRTAGAGHVISEKQAKRLYAIQMKSGKKQFEVKEYLKRMGFGSSKEVTSDKYDAIINWIQG